MKLYRVILAPNAETEVLDASDAVHVLQVRHASRRTSAEPEDEED